MRVSAPVCVAAAVILGCTPAASAATFWWDGPSGVLWSSTTSWSTLPDATTPNPAVVPDSADIAIFNVSTVTDPQTVYLDGNRSALGLLFLSAGSTSIIGGTAGAPAANNLTLGSSGITLSSGAGPVAISTTGTLSNSGTYTLAAGTQLSVSSRLAGNLWAVGSGTMTYSGGLNSTSNRIFVGGGGTLVQNGGSAAINNNYMMVGRNEGTTGPNLSGTGSYILQSGTLTVGQGIYLGWNAGSSGVFTQNGGFVETQQNGQGIQIGIGGGSGAYVLNSGTLFSTFGTAGAPYGGSFTFGGGTFRARAAFNTNLQSAVTTAIASGATAVIDTDGKTVTWSTALTGASAAGLTKLGSGALALNGANTYTGTTRIAAGSLSLGNASALQNTTLDLNAADSGTISAISTNGAFGGLAGSRNLDMLTRTLSIGNNGQSTTYSGNLSNGVLTKIGSGTLTLLGSNSFSGATTISAGALAIGNAGALGSGTTPLAVNAGTLDLSGYSVSVGTLSGSSGGTIASGVAGAVTLTVNAAGAGTFGGVIQNGSGTVGLTKSGPGTLTLSGSNSYSGATTIAGGVLGLGTSTALAGGGSLVFTGGTLQFGSANTVNYAARIKNSSSAISLDTNSQNLTFSGAIDTTNTGGLVKSGAGTLTLSGSNTYTGSTTISQGGITINAVSALPGYATAGLVSVGSAGTLTVQSGVSNADLATIATSGSFAIGSTLGIDTGGGNRTVTQNLGGNYSLAKSGGNTLVLSGSSTYAGNTLSSAGTLQAGSAGAFSSGTVSATGVTSSSGAVDLNGFSFSNPIVIGSRSAGPSTAGALQNTNASSTSVLSGNVSIGGENYVGGNGSITFNGVVSGGVNNVYSLYKQGTGTWLFANTANTFDGFYYQIGGTTEVKLLANINLASSLGQPTTAAMNKVVFGSGGTGGGTLLFTGSAASTSDRVFELQGATDAASNRINASGATASDTLTLTGSLTATRAGAYTVALGGTNAGVNTFAGLIANRTGTISLLKDGSTTWRLTAANTFTGATTISSGTLVVGNGGTTGSIASTAGISVASGASLTFNRTDSYGGAFDRVITGSGGVSVRNGSLNLTAANTYSGATSVLAGASLAVNGRLGASPLSVEWGATLMGSGTIGGPATISGLHSPGNSPGIQTFSSGLTYASGTAGAPSVTWELWGNSATNAPVVYDQIVVNGTLDFQSATPLSLAFSGGGSVVDWNDSFWGANQLWTIYSVTGTTQNFGNLGLVQDAANWFDSQNVAFAASSRSQGSFAVVQQGSDVVLVYIVPEPGTLALAGIGVCGGAWLIRRRRRETSPR